MEIRPITFKAACAFVQALHRHNKPPRGHKFSISAWRGGELVGVAMIGRPVARALDNGVTAEVIRTCTDGSRNVNSMLYGAAVRACKAMGYRLVVTYTQASESDASLRGAGFVRAKALPPRPGWADSSVALRAIRDPVGTGGVARERWEVSFGTKH